MEIKPNLNINSSGGVEATRPKKVKLQAGEEAQINFGHSEALNHALRESPDVRADVVAKAKLLVMDSSYPSAEMMKKVASLLARNIVGKDQ